MMQVTVTVGDATMMDQDALIFFVFKGKERFSGVLAKADEALKGQLGKLKEWGEVTGEHGEVTVVHTLGLAKPKRFVLVGLGKREEVDGEKVRRAIGKAVKVAKGFKAEKVAIAVEKTLTFLSPFELGRALTEGALLASYRYIRKSEGEEALTLKTLTLVTDDRRLKGGLEKGKEFGSILAAATNFARDLVNAPPMEMTPSALAEQARSVSESYGMDCEVYDEAWMERVGMHALRAVSFGSEQPPRFIVMHYRGDEKAPTLGLVGKGVTFDAGGLCLKPAEGMLAMKGDMAGAAAVIGAMRAIAALNLPVNVFGCIPATENMPGGQALKPGDILRTYSGKTVEVINTDAEGRLILADALAYARERGAFPILDAATLTTAAVIAVGPVCTAAFGNDERLINEVVEAGRRAGEPIWALPLFDEYRELIQSDFADIKNTGGRPGGAITAAWFLAEFVGDTPWVHLDIAPTFWSDRDDFYFTKGATGVAVRTFVQFVMDKTRQISTQPERKP